MNQPRRLSFSFHSLVAREPAYWFLYQPYLWWAQIKRKEYDERPDECMVYPDTELIIDGFQGSANSFATDAFKESQTSYVKLAHHLHSPAHIIVGINQKVPVWLTIREPAATVISLTSRWSHISVSQGLQSYIGFYRKLYPYASNYVVSTFEQTTQHGDRIVEIINARFDTNFDSIDVNKVNEKLKFKHSNPEELAQRKPIKEAKKKELVSEKNVRLLAQANEIYRAFEEIAQLSEDSSLVN